MIYNYDNSSMHSLKYKLTVVKKHLENSNGSNWREVKKKEYLEYLIQKRKIEDLQKEIKKKQNECLRLTAELEYKGKSLGIINGMDKT